MSIIIPANSAAGGGGYEVTNSLRFDGAINNEECLIKTFGSGGDRRKWTYSVWFKLSGRGQGNNNALLIAGTSGQNEGNIKLSNDVIDWSEYNASTSAVIGRLTTTQVFRDYSAWSHLVCVWDTANSTVGNRMIMYLNGSRITEYSTDSSPSLNEDSQINNNGIVHNIGRQSWNNSGEFNGYMAEICFIDGQALAPTSFGEFDEDSGIWKPIADLTDLTFGDTGFYLDFKDSAALGDDVSGNNNDWTPNNLAAINQTTDTCTNNFATWNPLVKTSSTVSISDGNTIGTEATNGSYFGIVTTMFPTSGKWYGEMKFTSLGTVQTGFITEGTFIDGDRNLYSSSSSLYWQSGSTSISTVLNSSGVTTVVSGGSNSTSAFNSTNDIIMYAWDVDNGRAWFGINGTWQNSGNPAGPTNWWSLPSDYAAGVSLFTTLCGCGVGTATVNLNTGNPPFTGTDKTDDNNRGSFEYQPPDGFLSLCTANLSEFG